MMCLLQFKQMCLLQFKQNQLQIRKRKSPIKSNLEGNDLQSIRKSPRLKEKAQRVGVSGKRPQKDKSIKAGGSSQEPTKGKDNKIGESSQNPVKGKGKEMVNAGNEGVKAKLPVKRSLRLQGVVGEKPQALTQPVRPPRSSNMLDARESETLTHTPVTTACTAGPQLRLILTSRRPLVTARALGFPANFGPRGNRHFPPPNAANSLRSISLLCVKLHVIRLEGDTERVIWSDEDYGNPELMSSADERVLKSVKLEQDFGRSHLQQNEGTNFSSAHHEESNSIGRRNGSATVLDNEQTPAGDSSFASTSSIRPAPICRQFWKAGNYDDKLNLKPSSQNGTGYLRIHPKFLHSNATSHKWAFGAMAELLDNSVDEIKNGATFVMVDKTSNPRDGIPALLVQDDGGGMDPEAMRRCLSFGFSDKKSKDAIGQYGNGFKTSSMRLGADVIVFSRCKSSRRLTQSVGSSTWKTLHSEEQHKNNLSILLKWAPVTTEAELLKHCDDIGPHGTKIIVYNLWQNDEGKMELDFETDTEDIRLSGKGHTTTAKGVPRKDPNENHLANRLHYSLRAYLSILYLRAPENFCILLRGRAVEYHNIANDLKYPEFILYRPQNVEGSVLTTIGFLKEAPAVNIHGFNVYHKNRLILPFWHVVTYSDSRGRGVVGVLEANFIEPTHNKQEFEKTSVFQKLETRLKEMTQEYWDYHCGLLGYQVKKAPRPGMMPKAASSSGLSHSIYKPVVLGKDTGTKPSFAAGAKMREIDVPSNPMGTKSGRSLPSGHQNSLGAAFKRKGHDHVVVPGRVKRVGVIGSSKSNSVSGGNLNDQEAASIIEENRSLRAQCHEFEKSNEELDLKLSRLTEQVREAQREYARVLLESKLLERVTREIKQSRPGV
ncbi:Histidine kinase-- DNA gyrase B-- and HSP90-like ATPase family protein [Striga hermonthica]|uniref:Histidine kinase-- DNA gyrase B-- and HSP90-like ATPase family protein n=1 Tax=Striga hermonthica TaxID=68872 RepID=A0A9N7MII9_STRHE|nr:Histidine kinase-- DNA gyrase B-- and HSP90-like ATPase family protein [Striga hermonthica]